MERARARAIRPNYANVALVVADPATMQFNQPFDAIVGRFVLMYQEDSVQSLTKITQTLPDGGLVVFQKVDSSACRSGPPVPAFDEAAGWFPEALRGSGARPELGLELHSLFLDSGLPAPSLRVDAVISGAAENPVYELLAEALRSLVPTLLQLDIASAGDIQIDSLADRIRKEVVTRRAVAMSYGLVGAWAKKPVAHDIESDAGIGRESANA